MTAPATAGIPFLAPNFASSARRCRTARWDRLWTFVQNSAPCRSPARGRRRSGRRPPCLLRSLTRPTSCGWWRLTTRDSECRNSSRLGKPESFGLRVSAGIGAVPRVRGPVSTHAVESNSIAGSARCLRYARTDAIQEVNVVKGILPAEYGGALGGQVNVLSRSGTNRFHGSLFENVQAEELNAREPFLTSKPAFTYN